MSIEDRLRETFNRQAHGAEPSDETWIELSRELGSYRRRRTGVRVLGIAVGLVLIGTGAVWLWMGLRPLQEDRSGESGNASERPVPVNPRVTGRLSVGDFPGAVAVGEGAVWLTVNDFGATEAWWLLRIDPNTNKVTGRVSMEEPSDVSVGAGSVWITEHEGRVAELHRVNPLTLEIEQTIPVEDPQLVLDQIAVGAGGVWVTATRDYPTNSEVLKVDPVAGIVAARIPLEGDARDIIATDNAAWVSALRYGDDNVVREATIFRIASDAVDVPQVVVRHAPALSGNVTPSVLTAGYGYVWTMIGHPTRVAQIDEETGNITTEPVSLDRPFLAFDAGVGGIWFRGGPTGEHVPSVISRLDPGTMEIDASVSLNALVIDAALDREMGVLWVANYERTVTRIDLFE